MLALGSHLSQLLKGSALSLLEANWAQEKPRFAGACEPWGIRLQLESDFYDG